MCHPRPSGDLLRSQLSPKLHRGVLRLVGPSIILRMGLVPLWDLQRRRTDLDIGHHLQVLLRSRLRVWAKGPGVHQRSASVARDHVSSRHDRRV